MKSTPSDTSVLSQDSSTSSTSTSKEIEDNAHIFDSVHGYIEIPERIKQIIDTPQFQRLRSLKQLGATYYTFPGASHNRFEHSIGVMHLSHKVMKHIQAKQSDLDITDDDIFCVTAAGLLHDIGHGPFSHVFDQEFMPNITGCKFRHETMSIHIVNQLFSDPDNNIQIEPSLISLINALISPSTHKHIVHEYEAKQKGFLFDIVANERTGIDVDKWDYLQRDSQYTGISTSFKYDRMLEHMRIIEDHVCFQEKTSYEVFKLFRTRYDLFKTVYTHKTTKSIEYMICDILTNANHYFDIVSKTKSPEEYLQLTDHILTQIEFEPIVEGKKGIKGLIEAKKLIKRLKCRQLYSCCGYLLLKPDAVVTFNPNQDKDKNDEQAMYQTPHKNLPEEKEKQIPKIQYKQIEKKWTQELFEMLKEDQMKNKENEDTRSELLQDHIKVQLLSCAFGMQSEEFILYNSRNPQQRKYVHVDQVTKMAGGEFKEVIVRVYCKNQEWKSDIVRVWRRFIREKQLVDQYETDFSIFVSPRRPQRKTRSNKRKLEFCDFFNESK